MGDTLPQTSFYPAAVSVGVVSLLEGGIEPPPSSTSHFSMVFCLKTLSFLSVNSPTEGLLRTWLTILSVFSPLPTSLIGRLNVFCLDTDSRGVSCSLHALWSHRETRALTTTLHWSHWKASIL
eukprot:TRINITY_DN10791_c0_g3_i1.p1 TRINITY_DN10791_c0_g3~~TRINITY_DN10791_c0_g3_i1.p1  ORF type:complete len:123 (+),score=14.59 TRINITY_DN10791_c0_g3_i1:621-989(+)